MAHHACGLVELLVHIPNWTLLARTSSRLGLSALPSRKVSTQRGPLTADAWFHLLLETEAGILIPLKSSRGNRGLGERVNLPKSRSLQEAEVKPASSPLWPKAHVLATMLLEKERGGAEG